MPVFTPITLNHPLCRFSWKLHQCGVTGIIGMLQIIHQHLYLRHYHVYSRVHNVLVVNSHKIWFHESAHISCYIWWCGYSVGKTSTPIDTGAQCGHSDLQYMSTFILSCFTKWNHPFQDHLPSHMHCSREIFWVQVCLYGVMLVWGSPSKQEIAI